MPGTDPAQAAAVIFGELPCLPYLPELPARGPGADMIGRGAAMLVDIPAETTARGWRLAERRGRDLGRARGYLSADLDTLEQAGAGYGGTLKVQVCGPWTLAAALELTRSIEPALSDPGATRDLVASLAEGVASHVAEVARRLPGARVVLQVDEPSLPAVLAGSVPTASGLRRVAAVDEAAAADGLRAVLSRAGVPSLVHCCAREVPFRCLRSAGADAVSFDLAQLGRRDDDAVGELAEAGLGLFLGAVPADGAGAGEAQAPQGAARGRTGRAAAGGAPGGPAAPENAASGTARTVIGLWRRIGLPADSLTRQVVLTPACGLAQLPPARARDLLTQCQAAAMLIPEMMEEGAA